MLAAARAPPRAMPISSIVNTCSVTSTADQGARQTIRRVARNNPGARDGGDRVLRQPLRQDIADLPGVSPSWRTAGRTRSSRTCMRATCCRPRSGSAAATVRAARSSPASPGARRSRCGCRPAAKSRARPASSRRPAARGGARRCGSRQRRRARRSRRFQGGRAHRRPSWIVWTRPGSRARP